MSRPTWIPVDAAMTFTEIAQEIGVSRQMIFADYCRAIYKIKNRPGALRALQQLVTYRRSLEDQRRSGSRGILGTEL